MTQLAKRGNLLGMPSLFNGFFDDDRWLNPEVWNGWKSNVPAVNILKQGMNIKSNWQFQEWIKKTNYPIFSKIFFTKSVFYKFFYKLCPSLKNIFLIKGKTVFILGEKILPILETSYFSKT